MKIMKTIYSLLIILGLSNFAKLAKADEQATDDMLNSSPLAIDGDWQRPVQRRKRPASNAQLIKRARKKNIRKNVKVIANHIEKIEISPDKVETILQQEDKNLEHNLNAAFNE